MSSATESDMKPSPVGAPHKSAAIAFRTSPLVDLSNKIAFSPQSELVTKLQQTSLSSANLIPNALAKTTEYDKNSTSSLQKTVSWSVGSHPPTTCNPAFNSSEIERLSLTENGHMSNDENKNIQIEGSDLPDHFLTLIKNVPNNIAISQLRRDRSKSASGAPLKRVSAMDPSFGCLSSAHKKIKGPLEMIKECVSSPTNFDSRSRAGSAPVPYYGPSQENVQNIEDVLITPTKQNEDAIVSEEGSITPIGIRARQKLPAVRKLPVSRSMVGLDAFSRCELNQLPGSPICSSAESLQLPPKPGSASPHKIASHSLEFRAVDVDTPLLIGDMSRKCLLSCRLCDGVPLVDSEEIARLLEGHYSSEVERAYIIDCRFPYEYDGGHIKGAVNFPHPFYENLKTSFFNSKNCASLQEKNAAWLRPKDFDACEKVASRIIMIFHCEFSSHRAPNTYRWFRTEDRNAHTIANYPKLDYPEAYVLAGGYKAFVKYCHQSGKQHLCDPPGGYIKQVDSRYSEHLRRFQRRIKTMSEVECSFTLLEKKRPPSSPSPARLGDFFIGSPSARHDSLSCDDITLSEPHSKAHVDEEDENGASNEITITSPPERHHDFEDFDDDMKIIHVKRETYRRRSDCPVRGLHTALGRASFEELSTCENGQSENP